MTDSALYTAAVTHQRLRPFRHGFAYRVWYAWLNLDELPQLATASRLFGYNQPRLLSFFDADHGARDGTPLAAWVRTQLRQHGIDDAGGPIRILCHLRVLGYVFNPLSVICCYRADGRLRAVLYEVKNTFGGQHGYLFAVDDAPLLRHHCAKGFYVSPFIDMTADYDFQFRPPNDQLSLLIRQRVAGEDLLLATLRGQRQPWHEAALTRQLWAMPLVTFKVIAAIHWQALWLWLKGARFNAQPPLPDQPVERIS